MSGAVPEAIRYQLMAHGCRNFSEAENPAQALDWVSREHYELVTLDLMMPTLGGISSEDAFATIRQDFPETAIVVISSIPHEKVKADYLENGALAYVVKPFTKY